MKYLFLIIIVLLVCIGCSKPKEKPYVKISENGKFASTNLEPEEIDIIFEPSRKPTSVFDNPELAVYPAEPDNLNYFTFEYNKDENSFFSLTKKIYCSDNPFAKELVDKYVITSNNIKCPI